MVQIRRYNPSDYEQVYSLHILALKDAGAYEGEGPWNEDMKMIEEVYLHNDGEFLVGENNGQIVCMGAFKKYTTRWAEVKRIRVHPDFQGLGLGRKVMEELEQAAQKKGYKGFVLNSLEIQTAAHRLYRNCGYEETAREVIDGSPSIWFEKLFEAEKPADVST